MPLYEIMCEDKDCEKIYEEIMSSSESLPDECPFCGEKGTLIKLISAPARAVVPGDPRDNYAELKRDAKRQAAEIMRGNQDVIADVYGEGVFDKSSPAKRVVSTKPSSIKRVK